MRKMQVQVIFFLFCSVLTAKGTPIDAQLENSSAEHKLIDSNETNKTLQQLESFEESHDVKEHEEQILQTNLLIQAGSVLDFDFSSVVYDISQKYAPITSGLKNLIGSTAAASEELYTELTKANTDMIQMLESKSEILVAEAINQLFKPLNMVENKIKQNVECGKSFIPAFNAIFKEVDGNLTKCTQNITNIKELLENETTAFLSSSSMVSRDMISLIDACHLEQSFVVGVFCVVNNLAEFNERVVLETKNMKQVTDEAIEKAKEALTSAVSCNKKYVEFATEKLNKLLHQVEEKCGYQKQQ